VAGSSGDWRRPRPAWIAAAALPVAIGIGWYVLPAGIWLGALREWVIGLGWIGVAALAAAYTAAVVLLAPGALLTIAAGFAYGFWGLPIALIAATTGASLAFLVARHLLRGGVRRAIETRRNIAAIDRAIAAEGWKIVLLLRLSPVVPFNLQNYLFGVTAVPFGAYVIATFVGIAPGTAVFVTIGALGDAALDPGHGKWALLGGGLIATVAAIVLVTRKARALLREAGVTAGAGIGDG
jgi:uncharacterized membrane protein YdjX (TVP38/TMEM64 family)